MSGETILEYTKAEMERVAEAMSSIVTYMEPDTDGCRPVLQRMGNSIQLLNANFEKESVR